MSKGPKGKTKDLEITMSNVKIKSGSDLSLLGLTMDQNLDFSKHVTKVCVLTRLRNILSARAKLITNKSAILPQLT